MQVKRQRPGVARPKALGFDRQCGAPLRGPLDPHASRVAELIREIKENPGNDWSTARMARKAIMSRSVFFEHFRDATGQTPLEYVACARMGLACELLSRSTASIKQIAQQVGYETASSFSTAFKRRVGCSPLRFREASQAR